MWGNGKGKREAEWMWGNGKERREAGCACEAKRARKNQGPKTKQGADAQTREKPYTHHCSGESVSGRSPITETPE